MVGDRTIKSPYFLYKYIKYLFFIIMFNQFAFVKCLCQQSEYYYMKYLIYLKVAKIILRITIFCAIFHVGSYGCRTACLMPCYIPATNNRGPPPCFVPAVNQRQPIDPHAHNALLLNSIRLQQKTQLVNGQGGTL